MAHDFYNLIRISFDNQWVEALFHILFYVAAYSLGHVALKVMKHRLGPRFAHGNHSAVKADIFRTFYIFLKRVLQLTTLYYILTTIPVFDKHEELISHICFVAGLIIGVRTSIKLSEFTFYFLLNSHARHLFPIFSRISQIVIFTVGLMIGLKHFNQDIWHIATALGIGSLAVGLAAQPTLMNLFAGFSILVDRPFQIGDRIRVASGDLGDVVDIGLRSTKIRTPDGNMLIMPNHELGNSRVINYSMPDNGTTQTVKLQFDLGADVKKIRGILVEGLSSVPGARQPVVVQMNSIYNGVIEFNLTVLADDFSTTGQVTDRVLETALFTLRTHGIPLAERTLQRQI